MCRTNLSEHKLGFVVVVVVVVVFSGNADRVSLEPTADGFSSFR